MKKFKAFTLAEVLITLAIIGVVAALTIPTVVTRYKKNVLVTQLKKTYNQLTNGFHTAMAQDGVTRLSDSTLWSKIPIVEYDTFLMGQYWHQQETKINSLSVLTGSVPDFKNELMKIFNLNFVVHDESQPREYIWYYPYYDRNVMVPAINKVKGEGIFFSDGAHMSFDYFDRIPDTAQCDDHKCKSLEDFQKTNSTPTKLWQIVGAITVDVNGDKGPNEHGRDYFNFVLGNDGTLYPLGGRDYAVFKGCDYSQLNSCEHYYLASGCDENGGYMGGMACAARIMEDGWKMNY